ncbi:beta-propeller domain-containing protein [Acetivibrio clariflavus]|uniref:Secreted protein with C-terminal beta-propeller domain n=1 Tax=Acetivibrio clariflavus (strain DSM 19732 / NBRC 101661 / EBR45) TaxID=720554 RepID=G8LSV8_ACECE|nr:beta-propeller domain-containing protein [Acetivibrio clariflavus]AEV70471.1 secreted protein with C-terminal beta-propeller domain [Acetivibrio clariflavus DSM 19732]
MKGISKLLSLLTFLLIAVTPIYSIVISEEIPAAQKSLEERLKDSVVLYVGSSQALVNNKEIQVDSSNPKVKPFIKESRTLVPVRFISEAMGAEVGWYASSSTVTIALGNRELKLVIGNKTMFVGKEKVPLEVAPEIVEGRTFLPLRSIAEALDKKVFYDRGLIVISENESIFDITSEKAMIDEVIAKVNNLPVVGSSEELEELIKNSRANDYGLYYKVDEMFKATVSQSNTKFRGSSESDAAANNAIAYDIGSGSQQTDYSTTNIQVQGVDEADVVKTDGQYIYQVNNGRIIVAKAYPADKMNIMDIVDFSDDNFTPQEIYLYRDLLVAIGSSYERTSDRKVIESQAENKLRIKAYLRRNSVKAIVCDISDKTNIKKIREVEIEGNYVSSRMIGSVLYMVSNNYQNIYYTYDGDMEIQTPFYRDSNVGEEYIKVDCKEIRYFPDSVEANYMLVAAFDIKDDEKANIQTYLGSGENIYVSKDNLYVAVTNYDYEAASRNRIMDSPVGKISVIPVYKDNRMTEVYKFSLNGSKMTYLGKGSVPGVILNQFSMDEHNGYFRMATTTNSLGFNGNVSCNNLYILDDTMNICGKIEDIAKGEEIYSVRFMGDRGYMVTFKTVDPLFVIDLKDPTKPEILGALKIPGYSDYLHPYDENHIIGFGKDTIEVSGGAFYMGMKIALFDVSDVNNPIQKFSEVIGDRGTDSELLQNHKALLFSKEKNLLAFPVTVAEIKDKNNAINEWGVPQYGEFVFQGAYVYNIDLDKGFTLKGKITHISDEEYIKSGIYDFYSPKTIERIIYINDTLYTLSKGMYKANRLSDLSEIGTLKIPQN